MVLRFHNTLTGQIEGFIAQKPDHVSLYTCGPTVYDNPHIGNWASYIYWDTLVRVLIANDYDVTRVMNITDVGHLVSDTDEGEDKIEKGARRENKNAWEIADYYTKIFMEGMGSLGLIQPQYITKATDFIPEILKLIKKLKEKGFTYQIDDGIYFDISKFPTYTDFAHLNLDAQKDGSRINVNPQKKHHSDFALWKFSPTDKKRDMEWETPADLLSNWEFQSPDKSDATPIPISQPQTPTMGFPGWAIECSAMAMAKLGETIDIHTGGIDHIPVHHTNEIAQSEAVSEKIFSNYWLHNNHLKVNGTKISKSLNNGYTLSDLEEKGFNALDFRMFVLQSHYRNESNFTFENLQSAKNRLHNWQNIAFIRHQIHDTISNNNEIFDRTTQYIQTTSQAIIDALNNDLGTPEALRIIDEAFTKILNTKLIDIDRHSFIQLIETIDNLLGIQLMNNSPDIPDTVKQIIIERNSARNDKDWSRADKLRNKLLNLGIILRDDDNESVWSKK